METTDNFRMALSEQAADWYLTLQAGPLDEAERRQFLAWLKASPLHIEEFLRVSRLSAGLKVAAQEPQVPIDELLAVLRTAPPEVARLETTRPGPVMDERRRRFGWPRLGIAAAALGALLVLAWLRIGPPAGSGIALQSAHGKQLERVLADGSVIRLNSDSRVTVRYSRSERFVKLEYGEALFQVTHERRPFRVSDGHSSILAVGTRFDVYRKADATLVTLVEGRLAIYAGDWHWPWSAPHPPAGALRLEAGQATRISDDGAPAVAQPADPDRSLGWLQHRIAFDHWPLAEVAAEFNRYAEQPIRIEDPELREFQISGNFDSEDVDSFLAYVGTLEGVVIQRTSAGYVVARTPGSR